MTITSSRRRPAIAVAFALIAGLLALGTPLAATADVVGDGPGTVSGTVTTTDGAPIAGAFVNVSITVGQATIFGESTTSDENGAYSFSGLPADTYDVSAYVPGYQQPAWQSATVSVAAPLATVNFVAAPFEVGVGTISGLVTADGLPVSNASVTISNQATSQSFFPLSDENGVYTVSGLSNGLWEVTSYIGDGYQYLYGSNATITDSAPDATIDLAFLSWPVGTSTITGVVADSATGEPLANVTVTAINNESGAPKSATSDDAGVYVIDLLPAGQYSISSTTIGYLSYSTELSVLDDETATANIALIAANATISGHVKDKNGAAVAGIYVDAHTAEGNFGGATTDANGDYLITNVGAAAYTVSVGGPGTAFGNKEKVVTPVANGNVIANFTLAPRKTGTISGAIFEPNGDYSQRTVCVRLYSTKTKKALDEVQTYGPDYGDGTFTFNSVKPGTYTVRIEDCDGDRKTKFQKTWLGQVNKLKDATTITLVAGQDSYENNVTLVPRIHH